MNTLFRQKLKAQAHHLKPVILLGAKGLTTAVIQETATALKTHELIKVKLSGIEKEDRRLVAAELCNQLAAELVQLIGSIAIVYKENEDK